MQNDKPIRRFAVIIQHLALIALTSVVTAQTATHTVVPEFGTRPDGANSPFTINLSMTPSDIDISGFSFIVAYDNNQAQLTGVSDNTGQPSAAAEYTIGGEQPLTGVPNVNVYVPVIMDTASDLLNPTTLAQLNFVTTSSYNEPDNYVWFHMDDHLDEGLIDGNFEPVPTAYETLDPESSVNDWMAY